MNLESHVYISKLVYEETTKVFPIHISKKFFRAGNVFADYSPLVWTHAHYFLVSWDYIAKSIDRVCSLATDEDATHSDLLLSFQMGLICHYITDFFCRAHIGDSIGPKREHLQYEDFLDNYRNSIKGRLTETDWLGDFEPWESAQEVKENLRAKVEEYRVLPASPERDLTMAIENCVKVMVSVIAIRLRQAVRQDIFALQQAPQASFRLPVLSAKELLEVVVNKNYAPVLARIKANKR